jgi:hypothetical protein
MPHCGCCCCCCQIRDKLATLVNVRRHKMEEGLQQISSTATVRVNGLGSYELNLIRQNFQGALDMFLKLETVSFHWIIAADKLAAAFESCHCQSAYAHAQVTFAQAIVSM